MRVLAWNGYLRVHTSGQKPLHAFKREGKKASGTRGTQVNCFFETLTTLSSNAVGTTRTRKGHLPNTYAAMGPVHRFKRRYGETEWHLINEVSVFNETTLEPKPTESYENGTFSS